MLLRTEIGIDAAGIGQLLTQVSNQAAAKRLQQLREQGLLTLGIVACDDDGQILGYAAFSSLLIDGEDRGWVILDTLAVDPSEVPSNLAQRLVFEGLDTLNEFSYSAVAVRGENPWYQQLGFQLASRLTWQQGTQKVWVYALSERNAIYNLGQLSQPTLITD